MFVPTEGLEDVLFLFDVDDTLTSCGSVGSKCFANAFEKLYDIKDLSIDWTSYRHVTDWGLTYAAFQQHLGKKPSQKDLQEVEQTYNDLLHEAYDAGTLDIRPVRGADVFIKSLQDQGHQVRMATGGWSYSAQFKLSQAAIHHHPERIYSANIAWSRASIMEKAIAASKEESGIQQVVYFGDGKWDVETCRQLNVPMVGLDITGKKQLKALGVQHVYHNYLDAASVIDSVRSLLQP